MSKEFKETVSGFRCGGKWVTNFALYGSAACGKTSLIEEYNEEQTDQRFMIYESTDLYHIDDEAEMIKVMLNPKGGMCGQRMICYSITDRSKAEILKRYMPVIEVCRNHKSLAFV
ncbi:TPA: hypothetical protein ACN34R_000688 [Vibrio parahaemolyticus]|uniref:hypothetical protein n=1 Tax=Vibrio parahaemolyticus TaxID=670 RepID=UPI0011201F38|nr:hypothetical protein [Vibrio parahaemolyticus]EIW7479749.1 hypothetical protein [Vibrio parahaemolyticus]EKZ9248951.1 hypothetical protein [Vibrio parahaemolyticus]ELA6677396.1 hypothetical protein [Vibrio parahaemolyticus]ELI6470707.1 hypothetical protein [Vibrio parahaemolyticus]TOH49877.1 hypothetical protein CGI80_13525 [Vibrio parahaemolyticus]